MKSERRSVNSVSFLVAFLTAMTLPSLVKCQKVKDYRIRYKDDAFFKCEQPDGEHVIAMESNVVKQFRYQWVAPSGEIVKNDGSSSSYNTTKYALYDTGLVLQIKSVEVTDFGIYTCIVFNENYTHADVVVLMHHGLNRKQHTYTDYISRIQYGFVFGFVVLIVMSLVCYNYTKSQDRFDFVSSRSKVNYAFSYFDDGKYTSEENEHHVDEDVQGDSVTQINVSLHVDNGGTNAVEESYNNKGFDNDSTCLANNNSHL